MAKTVYTTQDVTLQDNTRVTLKPLVIGKLRWFMKEWEKFSPEQEKDEDGKPVFDDDGGPVFKDGLDPFDIYITCSGIALERALPKEKVNIEEKFDENKEMTDEYREYLEDTLDMETIFTILEVCGGLKLRDPKLMEMAAQAAAKAQGGRN